MSKPLEKFQKDVLFILLLSAGIFVGLSLWSYNPKDPSFFSTGSNRNVLNLCGYFGSFLSDTLYQLLGLAAWIVVASFVAQARLLYKKSGETSSPSLLKKISLPFLSVLICASLIELYFADKQFFTSNIYNGGALGFFFTTGLVKIFNKVGASILLWGSFVALFLFYSGYTLKEVMELRIVRRVFLSIYGVAKRLLSPLFSRIKKYLSQRPQVLSQGSVRTSASGSVEERKKIVEVFSLRKEAASENKKDAPDEEANFFGVPTEKNMIRANRKKTIKQKKFENWNLPSTEILTPPAENSSSIDEKTIKRNTAILEDKLAQFAVNGKVVSVRPGPAVTMYEFKPNADVKVSKITELADDLSLALSTQSIIIIAPLLGRDVVGIEVANPKRETVYLREIIESEGFWKESLQLPVVLGKKANGDPETVDLRKMPHLLIAGTTGSGKSVFVNSLLAGLLFKHSPETLKLILVDPKQVDLASFHSIPHLIMPPVMEPKKAVLSLKWAVKEMDKRYRSMSKFGARNIESFNQKIKEIDEKEISQHQAYNEELEQQHRDKTEGYYCNKLPYIVIVVEEFGDLMFVDKINAEQLVVRLAQMARACGMHLVLAMQSPRKDVVTGLIKTNIPGRISFKVASKMDSRIILDDSGAERLLAQGDMLFLSPGVSKPQRHHGAWVSEEEIQEVASFWSEQSGPEYDEGLLKMFTRSGEAHDSVTSSFFEENAGELDLEEEGPDERYDELLSYVSGLKEVSASLLQRKFRLGYPRAARIIETFEKEGVVGPPNGSKPRQVLVSKL